MKELLKEYKETRFETKKLLEELEDKRDKLRYSKNGEDLINELSIEELTLLHQYEEDLSIIRNWISNLNYTIDWIRTGRQPQSKRGVERRSAYEREVPFDPYWIQLKKEDADYALMPYETDCDNSNEDKENLIKEIIKPLNKKEKEIVELAANDFSLREIAKYLHIPKSTVGDTLNRCKRKIENEGWEIV